MEKEKGNGNGNGKEFATIAALQTIVQATERGLDAHVQTDALERAVASILEVAFRPDLERRIAMQQRACQKALNRAYWCAAKRAAKAAGILLDE